MNRTGIKNKRDKKYVSRGSFTIEAACVMSLILVTIIGILCLSFFVHNRAWLTAAACEAALSGSMEGIKKDGQVYETAVIRGEELANTGFFGAENLQCFVNTGKKVTVTYEADTIASFGGFRWKMKTEGSSKIICPAEWIRKVKAAQEVIDEFR